MNLHVPPICYINLARETTRRERMEREVAQQGLSAQRLDAVFWKDLSPEQKNVLYSANLNARQFHFALVDGEKGCYASHIQAWRNLLASDAPSLVVLEDDVCLEPGFAETLAAIAQLPPSWDMIKLMGRRKEKVRARQPLCPGVDLIEYQKVPSWAAGYVVSRSGAQKLLSSRVPFGRPVDVDLRFWWENDLHILGVMPPVVKLDTTSQASGIGTRNVRSDWRTVWRKFALKATLHVLNAYHRTTKPSRLAALHRPAADRTPH